MPPPSTRAIVASVLFLLSALAVQAQDSLPVVIVYQDQLIEKSLAGKALRAEEEATTQRLVEERKQIERALEAEERALAERRPGLERAEFARLAEDFDAKVRKARSSQEEKAVSVQRMLEQNRQRFLDSLRPVLIETMQRFGASVLLEGRTILLADPSLDVTGDVIARMDEVYLQNQPATPDP